MLISKSTFTEEMENLVKTLEKADKVYDKVETLIGDQTVIELLDTNFFYEYINLITKITQDTDEVILQTIEQGAQFPIEVPVNGGNDRETYAFFESWDNVYDYLAGAKDTYTYSTEVRAEEKVSTH